MDEEEDVLRAIYPDDAFDVLAHTAGRTYRFHICPSEQACSFII